MIVGGFHPIAIAVSSSLAIAVALSASAIPSNQDAVLKPDTAQVAFFDRPAALAAARASSIPSPLIVMLTTDPWLMAVGSDSPKFALYSDGTAIFATKTGYASTRLDRTRLEQLVSAFDYPELRNLAGGYQAIFASDQPDNWLLFYGHGKPFFISVYGRLDSPSVRSALPWPVLSAFQSLRNFAPKESQPWLPSELEVMVWPYVKAPDPLIVWPEHWPGLNAPGTRKSDESYSIFLPSSEAPALRAFLARTKPAGAVEIDGKKWAVGVRIPFPHEALWMAPKTE